MAYQADPEFLRLMRQQWEELSRAPVSRPPQAYDLQALSDALTLANLHKPLRFETRTNEEVSEIFDADGNAILHVYDDDGVPQAAVRPNVAKFIVEAANRWPAVADTISKCAVEIERLRNQLKRQEPERRDPPRRPMSRATALLRILELVNKPPKDALERIAAIADHAIRSEQE